MINKISWVKSGNIFLKHIGLLGFFILSETQRVTEANTKKMTPSKNVPPSWHIIRTRAEFSTHKYYM